MGGIELGLKLVIPHYRTIYYIESDFFAQDVLATRIADSLLDKAPIWSFVETWKSAEWVERIDIISSGFPCQPWSVAGKKKGIDDERWIWPSIAKIIHEVRPKYVFLENVVGLLNTGLGYVLRDLAQSGYDAEWDVFSARACGAPHLRERIFILAHRPSLDGKWLHDQGDPWREPEETTGNRSGAMDCSHRPRLQGWRTDKPQYKDELPSWPPSPEDFASWRRVLDIDPTLEPSFCGVADGISDELEQFVCQGRENRLKALGNAVVPLVAAVAFVKLFERSRHEF
jgi:DNA (cytosine-5)-methyltransferase 1